MLLLPEPELSLEVSPPEDDVLLPSAEASVLVLAPVPVNWPCAGGVTIVNVNEAEKLKELSANYTDSIPFQFELSAVQFRKYLRGNAFQNADTFLVKSRRSGL